MVLNVELIMTAPTLASRPGWPSLNTPSKPQEHVDTLQTEHLTPHSNRVGFIIAYTYTRPMKYTGLEKLIFLFSTIWLLHWGVRLTQVGINALY